MGIYQIAKVAARDPVEGFFLVQQRVMPNVLVDRLERLGRSAGLRRPTFLLSFDCDTNRDILVAKEVHARLAGMGITAVYAVPGEILEAGAGTWQSIAAAGAEFLNHGFRRHTEYRDGQYVSTLFYDQMEFSDVEADIRAGHEAVTRVIGRAPTGFRTPHFGTFARPGEITRLHDLLARLNYDFSTSTVPYVALRHGPFTRRFGLVEIPVTGCVDFPMTILDSYGFRFSENRFSADDYERQAKRWADLLQSGRALFVNLYADPSQVADWPGFFSAMHALAPFARGSYREVLSELHT